MKLKILDRYVLGEFLRFFVFIMAAFAVMFLLKEVFSELTSFLSEDPPIHGVIVYFVNVLPGLVIEVVPLAVMLAMMFSIGAMAKNKELLAMHAGGISYLRTALPLGIAMLVIALGVFVCNETLVPQCEARARYAKDVLIKGKRQSVITRNKNITTKGKGNRFYTMKSYDREERKMIQPTIMDRSADGQRIVMRIDAREAQLVTRKAGGEGKEGGEGDAARSYWRFTDAVRYAFNTNGVAERQSFEHLEIPMEEDLDLFLSSNREGNEMSIGELNKFAKVQGMRSKGDYYKALVTNLHVKLSFPIGIFIIGLIGYTFAVRSSIRSLVLEFGLALLSVIAYYSLFLVGSKLGATGVVSPVLAAWATDALFFGFLVWRFRELERVPRY